MVLADSIHRESHHPLQRLLWTFRDRVALLMRLWPRNRLKELLRTLLRDGLLAGLLVLGAVIVAIDRVRGVLGLSCDRLRDQMRGEG
jgi:hypothetical protein